ncbi:centrosomal protein of 72 kDa isoform X2 [Paramisgurnus dabryanus]|uniref:centrosomal protein of 72 kDa isoform X2 n=1 Tax=Paramisgurnus dabryanus TaxID=90735 RepID=UPI003CCF0134
MAADGLITTEQWIRDKLNLQHICLAEVRSLALPGSYEGKICHVGSSLKNFVRLKTLDLSHNALVTVKGIEHLEMLETLNLYYNKLDSLQDIFTLHKLQNLKDLDLRLNPVVRRHPHYRLYFIHAMVKLRKLDDCPVRDRERKAALLHFSSETNLDQNHKKNVLTQDTSCRSSDLRIKAVEQMMKTLLFLEGNEEAALNEVSRKYQTLSKNPQHDYRSQVLQEDSSDVINLINASGYKEPSIQNQESKSTNDKNGARIHARHGVHRVTFGSPVVESHHPTYHRTVQGESIFTQHPTDKRSPLQEDEHRALEMQNSPNPVLHPPRLTYRSRGTSASERKPRRGAYRKPMELLLSMIEEHWSGQKYSQQDSTLLIKMVQILTMMDKEVVDGEQEIQTLKETVKTLNAETELQEEQHHSEIKVLKLQLQQAQESIEALNGHLKNILEENVSLQKQLIRAEEKLLSSRMKRIQTHVEDRASGEPEELNRPKQRVQEQHRDIWSAHKPQEHYKSLIARNECLLEELEEALMS